MEYHIDIQHATDFMTPASDEMLAGWAKVALKNQYETAELTLRLVDIEEMSHLNQTSRQKKGPTNVLAFPSSHPETIPLDQPFLGDIIICPEILEQESQTLSIPLIAHWAHIVIHGILHLLGHDHIEEQDTLRMQGLEIQILAELDFANPYAKEESI